MRTIIAGLAALLAGPVLAQGVTFDGQSQDPSAPVEVSAEALEVNQSDGTAVFTGNVVVTQGEMRLTAPRLQINYAGNESGANEVESYDASGGVTMVSGDEAAEGQTARYDLATGRVVMTGDVVLTQGGSIVSGDRLDYDLATGSGQVTGRVRSVFRPGD